MILALVHSQPNALRKISESHLISSLVSRYTQPQPKLRAVAMPMSPTSITLSPHSPPPPSPQSMPPSTHKSPAHCDRCDIHFTHPSHLSDHRQWSHGSNFTFFSNSDDDNGDSHDRIRATIPQPLHNTVSKRRTRHDTTTLTKPNHYSSTGTASTTSSRTSTNSSLSSIQSPATTSLRWKYLYGRGKLLGGRDVLAMPQQRLTALGCMELGRRFRRMRPRKMAAMAGVAAAASRRVKRAGKGYRGCLLSEVPAMQRRKMSKANRRS